MDRPCKSPKLSWPLLWLQHEISRLLHNFQNQSKTATSCACNCLSPLQVKSKTALMIMWVEENLGNLFSTEGWPKSKSTVRLKFSSAPKDDMLRSLLDGIMRLDWRSKNWMVYLSDKKMYKSRQKRYPQEICDLNTFSIWIVNQCGRNEVGDVFSVPEAACSPSHPESLHTPFRLLFPNPSSVSAWTTPAHPSKPNTNIFSVKSASVPKTELNAVIYICDSR